VRLPYSDISWELEPGIGFVADMLDGPLPHPYSVSNRPGHRAVIVITQTCDSNHEPSRVSLRW